MLKLLEGLLNIQCVSSGIASSCTTCLHGYCSRCKLVMLSRHGHWACDSRVCIGNRRGNRRGNRSRTSCTGIRQHLACTPRYGRNCLLALWCLDAPELGDARAFDLSAAVILANRSLLCESAFCSASIKVSGWIGDLLPEAFCTSSSSSEVMYFSWLMIHSTTIPGTTSSLHCGARRSALRAYGW